MYSSGILMEQHLQCTQFCALITNLSPCCHTTHSGGHTCGTSMHTLAPHRQREQEATWQGAQQNSQRTIRTSGYSYTPAGQKRDSGAPYVANDTLDGTSALSGLMRKWLGWSCSCAVPARARLVRRSNDNSPSGLGYSMGWKLEAGLVHSESLWAWWKVHGSMPRSTKADSPEYLHNSHSTNNCGV